MTDPDEPIHELPFHGAPMPDPTTDPRKFRSKEAREELEDALVYLACAWLKTEFNLEVTR
jgi:hypothetical protein